MEEIIGSNKTTVSKEDQNHKEDDTLIYVGILTTLLFLPLGVALVLL